MENVRRWISDTFWGSVDVKANEISEDQGGGSKMFSALDVAQACRVWSCTNGQTGPRFRLRCFRRIRAYSGIWQDLVLA